MSNATTPTISELDKSIAFCLSVGAVHAAALLVTARGRMVAAQGGVAS